MIDSEKLKDLLVRLCTIKEDGTLDGEEADRSENLHRLFMYPAMMVPATQSAMIEALTHILPSSSMAIDPFMGSGTTAKVARALCRKYIGFEISQEYVDLANKRLQDTKTLFDE